MSYDLEFYSKALEEWQQLDNSIKVQFKNKLRKRQSQPRVPKDKLGGYTDMYKIKLKKGGFRLAYEVRDKQNSIFVIAVGKREDKKIYKLLSQRQKKIGL